MWLIVSGRKRLIVAGAPFVAAESFFAVESDRAAGVPAGLTVALSPCWATAVVAIPASASVARVNRVMRFI